MSFWTGLRSCCSSCCPIHEEGERYIEEGKSYLTVAFGCTGGQHRSVMIAEEVHKRLAKEGYRVKAVHRDMPH